MVINLDEYFEASDTEKIDLGLRMEPEDVVEALLDRPLYASSFALEKLSFCNEQFHGKAHGKEFFIFFCRHLNSLSVQDIYVPEDQELFTGRAPTKSEFFYQEMQQKGLYPLSLYHSHHELSFGAQFSDDDEGMHEGFTRLGKENSIRCNEMFGQNLDQWKSTPFDLYYFGEPGGIITYMASDQKEEQIRKTITPLRVFRTKGTIMFSYSMVDTYDRGYKLRLRIRPVCGTCTRILELPKVRVRRDVQIKNGFLIKDGVKIEKFEARGSKSPDYGALERIIDNIVNKMRRR